MLPNLLWKANESFVDITAIKNQSIVFAVYAIM